MHHIKTTVRVVERDSSYGAATIAEIDAERTIAELPHDLKTERMSSRDVETLREVVAGRVRELGRELDAQLDHLAERVAERERAERRADREQEPQPEPVSF